MVRHAPFRVVAPLIALPVLLGAAACGSSAKSASSDNPVVSSTSASESSAPASSEAPSTEPATSASASASASPSPTAPAGPPRCTPDQLTATKGAGQGAAGHIFLNVILTNTAKTACHLLGYPGMALLDSNRDPLTSHVTFGGGMLPPTAKQNVVLAPSGGQASFTLVYSDVPTGNADPATACPEASFESITPPDDTTTVELAAVMAPCDGKVNVSPVVGGPDGVTS